MDSAERIGLCLMCMKRCNRFFKIAGVIDSAPFCGYGHAGGWRKAQGATGRISQVGGPRPEPKRARGAVSAR